MRFIKSEGSLYFTAGPVRHKCLEVGYNAKYRGDGGFDFCWGFRTRGDHAGLTFNVEIFSFLFEFNIHDDRHWNWEKNRWKLPGEDTFEGYPHE